MSLYLQDAGWIAEPVRDLHLHPETGLRLLQGLHTSQAGQNEA